MSELTQAHAKRSIGSVIVAGFFVLAGIVTLYDTTSYSDVDSMVFPRAAAVALVICSLLSLVFGMLKPLHEPGFGRGTWWRRVLLVASMLLACFVMPLIGFLPAGILAFAGCMLASMHQRWSILISALYFASGLLIMIGFYSLFRYALHVPLP